MATGQSGNTANQKIIAAPQPKERFSTPYAACNFVVNWDGHDVSELLDAILCARRLGDRFIQDKLIEYILAIPLRHPRPKDVPPYAGAPVWAVDESGRALVGMPGRETIVGIEALRRRRSPAQESYQPQVSTLTRNGTDGLPS